jgi:hypothetical protein
MDKLLAQVIEAHGGLDRWSRITGITAHMKIGGPFWEFKGQPGILGEETVDLDRRAGNIQFTPFTDACRTLEFRIDPQRVSVKARDGTVVEERTDPRRSFAGYDRISKWDALQVGYFIGYAFIGYLTEPFLLASPGFEAYEIAPWEENGQRWRRLHVTFPRSIATHSSEQVFYFDDDGMQQRMDYATEVNGNALVAHYTDEPRIFDGIVVPTRRRIRGRGEDGVADMTVDYITLDIHDVRYRTS